MNSTDDLQQALHDLATTPAATELGDRALRRARRIRRVRVTGVGVLILAGLLVLPTLVALPGRSPMTLGGPGANPDAGNDCIAAKNASDGVKRVDPADWPSFVRIVVSALPVRTDYEMQSGYDLCGLPDGPNAYAVINLGSNREQGSLAVNLYREADPAIVPGTCAELQAQLATPNPHDSSLPNPTLLSCQDATATTPAVYVTRSELQVRVAGVYGDRRAIVIEATNTSGPGLSGAGATAASLRPVVTSPELAALLT